MTSTRIGLPVNARAAHRVTSGRWLHFDLKIAVLELCRIAESAGLRKSGEFPALRDGAEKICMVDFTGRFIRAST